MARPPARHAYPATTGRSGAACTRPAILCLTGTYNQLLNYVIFAALLFYAFTTTGLFILRARRPDLPRPYRAFGYPALPLLYILLCCAVMVLLLLSPTTRTEAVSGLVLVLIGIPVFYLWRRVERHR